VTVYDADLLFFGDAPYDKTTNTYRYGINDLTPGVDFNGGNNFTLYLSATPPPTSSYVYKNWIPIGKLPSSKFVSYLRLYGPDQAAQDNTWAPPPIVAHKGSWGEAPLPALTPARMAASVWALCVCACEGSLNLDLDLDF
jgi:hypothetical protein